MTDPEPAGNDDHTTVAELREVVARFVAERDWRQFHTPKNLSMSLAIEAAELMEHFQWLTPEEAQTAIADPTRRQAMAEEVADCLSYLLALSSALDLDLSTALRQKMVKNAVKYPADKFRGRSG